MDNPFSVGEPVQCIAKPNEIGTVCDVVTVSCCDQGGVMDEPVVVVRPAGSRFSKRFYDPAQLRLCNCTRGRTR